MYLATVEGFFLSAFLEVFFDRIVPRELQDLFPKQFKYDHQILNKLKQKLLVFRAVLEDAETKQSKDGAIRLWLEELQQVLFEADDLLDQITTEALRVKVEDQYSASTNYVRPSLEQPSSYFSFESVKNKFRPSSANRHLSASSTDPSYFSLEFLKEIMPKLEGTVHKLDDFQKEIDSLGLIKNLDSRKRPLRDPSTSLVDEDDVSGRDAERENLVGKLLSGIPNSRNVSVISIVGLGGVGKTTLAQLIYKDERVNRHFDTKAWVCVSEEYDYIRVIKDLLNELSIPIESDDTLNSLETKLIQQLSLKKFFLVLDDIWNREYGDWSKLSILFNSGKSGSKVVVTTRDEKVAQMIDRQSIYLLNLMSEEDCWSLFKKHAFMNGEGDGNLEFELTGKEIVKKCGGLPLAIRTVAGLLRSKETIEEWEEILASDEWDQPNNQVGILPSLRLSFTYLPSSQLKQCFAYCAIFHKGYRFGKDEVIRFWMANDLLLESSKRNKRLEDTGDEFFCELRSRSLIQQSSEGKFSMHDLVNDLAKVVSGKYFVRLEDYEHENGSPVVARHFSYLRTDSDVLERFKPLNEWKFLRTFLPLALDQTKQFPRVSQKVLQEVLPASKSLKILSLFAYKIRELPNSFASLKQLRFLDLSRTFITKLPNWVCTFYNLQTLLLADCWFLRELPKDIKKLVNLRHLDIRKASLTKMPMEIGRLKNLQFLSNFIVGKCSGSSIEELGKLWDLHGEFTISGLENVADCESASVANLKGKKHIKKLTLEWNGESDSSRLAFDVLENLQPHPNIEHLEIKGYCGTSFPDWLGCRSFRHMISLCLANCQNCFCLPAIGQLPSLKHLSISHLGKVTEIDQEVYGSTKPFPCLKVLMISDMEEWREWHFPENVVFSCLEELSISNCPKLNGKIPKQLLSLRKFVISECPELIGEIPEKIPLLTEFRIYKCPKLFGEFAQQIQSVKNLSIGWCPWLVNSDGELTIFECRADAIEHRLCCLREVAISSVPELEKLWSSSSSSSSSSSDLKIVLPYLEKLHIWNCPRLSINGLPITLKQLSIRDGGELELETSEMTIEQLEMKSASLSIKNLCLSLFPYLRDLDLYQAWNMEELSIGKGNQNLTPLQSLNIRNCYIFKSFPEGGLPAPNLTNIFLSHLPKLKSLPERMNSLLPSLRDFHVSHCPEIECIPKGGLPSSLQSLYVDGNCRRLWSCCREWGLERLHSLTRFQFFFNCKQETLPPDDLQFPSTLKSLDFGYSDDLKMLNYGPLRRLICLQSIYIIDCNNLQLPKEGLPVSLRRLEIKSCALLKQRLEWEKGEDWPKVAHIPCIILDDKLIP